MLGRYTPFYGLAFKFVPGINLFRRPTDASFVFGIALAILSGHCLADYVRHGLPQLRPVYGIAVLSVLLGVVGSAIAFSARTGHALHATREVVVASVVMLVAGLILSATRRPSARLMAAGIVTLLAIAELLLWNTASRLNAESRSSYAVLEAPAGGAATGITLLETAIAADHRRGEHPRVEVLGLGGPWQNLAMVRGWEATNGYNPLRIGLYDRLVAPGEENWNVSQRQFPPSFDNYNCPLAQALGLTYLVLGQPLDRLPGLSTPPSADLLLSGPPLWIYRLVGAMPRARVFSRLKVTRSDGRLLVEPLDDCALNVQTTSPRSAVLPKSESPGVVQIESSGPGRVEALATLTVNGLLVLHDIYYPGWIAEIDGRLAPMLRADELFRAVELPAGTHHVVFRFTPFSLVNLRAALNATFGRPNGSPEERSPMPFRWCCRWHKLLEGL
jgi:hypothetical protein